eukprot:TRINITY_DN7015_c0_g1_i3.p1 TRINITY_DN7015_c0_g1~~TRINITY_DN7015_c0_g1_i3.p1  ORF type:complete len:294 (+),score=48.78 TRINITY_DN7015_c0_g1_i3:147-1028(+)
MYRAAKRFFSTESTIGSFIRLRNRAIVGIDGKDAKTVLQGLMTNDMQSFAKRSDVAAIHGGFLNLSGRIFTDAFVVKPLIFQEGKEVVKEDEYFIDCTQEKKEELVNHIKKHALRKKIELFDISDQLQVVSLLNHVPNEESSAGKFRQAKSEMSHVEDGDYTMLIYQDPRSPLLGYRIIASAEDDDLSKMIEGVLGEKNQEYYDLTRYLCAIPEGEEVKDMLPLNCNFDFTGSISFSKGNPQDLVESNLFRLLHWPRTDCKKLPYWNNKKACFPYHSQSNHGLILQYWNESSS